MGFFLPLQAARKETGRTFFHGWKPMNTPHPNPAVRKGQFLWRDPQAQMKYLTTLKKRISEGYYFKEKIFSRIADELAPVIDDITSYR